MPEEQAQAMMAGEVYDALLAAGHDVRVSVSVSLQVMTGGHADPVVNVCFFEMPPDMVWPKVDLSVAKPDNLEGYIAVHDQRLDDSQDNWKEVLTVDDVLFWVRGISEDQGGEP